MNQENEGTQATQRPSNSSGSSLFFLLVMMFMLFSGGPGETPATQNDIREHKETRSLCVLIYFVRGFASIPQIRTG